MKLVDESDVRKEAIQRYLRGEKPRQIYGDLSRTKQWFSKWLTRFQTGEEEWFLDQSKAPLHPSNRLAVEAENAILEARRELANLKYAQVGANAINWWLQKRGIGPFPVATINRVIKRHDLTRKKEKYQPKGKTYPRVPSLVPNNIHQADLVGPRFLKNDGRFYCLNVMDIDTHRIYLNPCRTKEDDNIAQGLIESWKALGLPDFLQIDNELAFRGSNRYPRSFGLVIRLCLSFGIQPIFIPVGEPWRNGEIESFQDDFDKNFYRSQFFPNYEVLCQEAGKFAAFHNENYVYSCLKGRTPNLSLGDYKIQKLPGDYKLSEGNLPLEDGFIHLVRFIRSDRILDVFGEKFTLARNLVYEYVTVTICTDIHQLQVRHDGTLVQVFPYPIPIACPEESTMW